MHLLRGRPGRRCHWLLDDRPSDRLTWQLSALWARSLEWRLELVIEEGVAATTDGDGLGDGRETGGRGDLIVPDELMPLELQQLSFLKF